jgi:4-amino-4-deoxy-L-arabinose transferase-like glycosyltransferase
MVVLLGLLLRVYPWLQPHGFLGVLEQDDGVYYGAARLLLEGQLPYRDVTIIHPPGSALLLTPFATLGVLLGDPIGMAAARLVVAAVAVANTVLVHRIAHRLSGSGRTALLAAAVYAVMPNAVVAEHTVLLEPLVNLACLLALLLLLTRAGDRSTTAAGVLLAVGISIKLFGAAYLLAVLVWLLATRQHRRLGRLAAGVGIGAGVTLLPFFLAAPHAFWQDVVVTQAARPQGADRAGRLVDLVGFGPLPLALGIPLALVLVALLVRRTPPPYRLWWGVLALSTAAFVVSSTYFPHYAAFLAPALALVLTAPPINPIRYAGLVAVLVGFTAGSLVDDGRTRGQGDLRALGDLVPPGSCVFAEHVSVAIAADVFSPPSADCPGWLDGRGLLYSRSTDWPRDRDFYFEGFTGNARWQAELLDQLEHADVLLIKDRPDRIPEWAPATRAYVQAHFEQIAVSPGRDHAQASLWRRVSATPQR